ncbi:hypothetical protein [Oricola indica]|uniref:hypothetical protein n=1 Tax=Oricola indica TaxID=2872591 RepID=UPI003CCB9153
MYDFKLEDIDTATISLDLENNRIVGDPPKNEQEIVDYLYKHEDLRRMLADVSANGVNPAAELPYLVPAGSGYLVIEGNTRVTTYRLLSGSLQPPAHLAGIVPKVSDEIKQGCKRVRCAIAQNREQLKPLQAEAHFGRGAKSPWSYLGSRQAVYRDWKSGLIIDRLADIYRSKPAEIRSFLIQYDLYLKVLALDWSAGELEKLKEPNLQFNPPVRFFDTSANRQRVGVEFDTIECRVNLVGEEADGKLKHLIRKQLLEKGNSITATSTYDEIFADYTPPKKPDSGQSDGGSQGGGQSDGGSQGSGSASSDGSSEKESGEGDGTQPSGAAETSGAHSRRKPYALFDYRPVKTSQAWAQMLKEARALNCKNYPVAGAGLLRSIIEYVLKGIIDDKNLNPKGKDHTLVSALDLVLSAQVLSAKHKRILVAFRRDSYPEHLNLLLHGNRKAHHTKILQIRDAIDEFIKDNR